MLSRVQHKNLVKVRIWFRLSHDSSPLHLLYILLNQILIYRTIRTTYYVLSLY